jgi:hypothetical protein
MKANESKSNHVTFTTRRERALPPPPQSIQTMCSYPIKKMSSILGYTLTGDLHGTNTFSQNGNNYESLSPKCIGYSDESQNSLQATNFS